MKCPVMSQPYESGEYQSKWHGIDCLKEECPLWHPTTQSCDIDRIASNLSTIANALVGILEKMPHEGQFKR